MKRIVSAVLFMLACCAFLCAACADEKTAISMLRKHLMQGEDRKDVLCEEDIAAIVSDLVQNGYEVSYRAGGAETYDRYDVAMDILEEILGNYYSWSIEEKALFDQMMVDCGELPFCYNLMPGENEIPQTEAQELAFTEIENRFHPDQSSLDNPLSVDVSYYLAGKPAQKGMWRFGIELDDQSCFEVDVTDGVVTRCQKRLAVDDLEKEYGLLCDQRGAFFKWSLREKMEFADSLPQKLSKARENDTLLRSDLELEAIASYGFCLPTEEALSQEEAKVLAAAAMEEEFHIPAEDCAETYYSFFWRKSTGYVWRVIFWGTRSEAYTSVVVDMQALTGSILSVKANGHTASEYIPYIERL